MSTACPDRRDALAHLRHQPLVGAAHGGDDAELGRAGGRGLHRRLDQRGDVEPGGAHRRGEQPGLRAEVAVLGAAAGLERHDALDLDLRAAPAHAHLVRELEQVGQVVVAEAQHLEHLCLGRGRRRPRAPARGRPRGSAARRRLVRSPGSGASWSSGCLHRGRTCRRKSRASNAAAERRLQTCARREQELERVERSGALGQRPGQRPRGEGLEVADVAPRRPGRAPRATMPSTTPARPRPRWASASSVRAVWLSVPSAGCATTRTGAASSRAQSAIVAPSSSKRTSRPPAPSTTTRSRSSASARIAATESRRSRAGSPLTRAAAAGASGIGEAGVLVDVVDERRGGVRRRGLPARRTTTPV